MYIKSLNHRFSSFRVAITMILLGIFCSSTILNNPLILVDLIFVVLSAILFIKKPSWALALMITFGINFFGVFRFTDFPSIPLPGLGSLFYHDILLLLFTGIMVLKYCTRRSESLRSSIGCPIAALIVLTVIQGIRSLLEGNDPHFIANQMRPVAFYLSYFLVLGSFRRENELIHFMKLLILIAIITAGISYFQTLTGGLNLATKVDYRTDYHIYQSLNVGMLAMAFVFLLLFSMIIGKKGDIKFALLSSKIILLWIGGSLLLTLARNIWGSTLLGMGIIILLNWKKLKKTMIILFIMIAFFTTGAPVVERITGSKSFFFIISDRILTGYQDIRGLSGRTDMMLVRWHYMINNNPLLGVGFSGGEVYKPDEYFATGGAKWDPTWFCGHNIIGDLAVRYGLSGFFVMGWLLVTIFYKAIPLYRTLPRSWQKSLACGLLAFNIQAVFISYIGGSLYLALSGIVVMAPSWAVLELIDRFHKREQNRTLIAGEAQ